MPTLIVHDDDDQIVPMERGSPLIKAGQECDPQDLHGRTHGLVYTHKDQLNADLLAFLKT